MIIDFEHHYFPVELGRRLGMNMDSKIAVRRGDALAGNLSNGAIC